MSTAMRLKALAAARLLHPDPAVVTAPLFAGRRPFFLAADKVQVKYEMLPPDVVDGLNVSEAAASHGYSRPAYYLVADSFAEAGMLGLLDERRGPARAAQAERQILAFIRSADPNWSSAALAQRSCGASRSRCIGAPSSSSPPMRALWPVQTPSRLEYEALRALALADADLCGPIAVRFARQGLAGLIAWRRMEPPFSVSLAARSDHPGRHTPILAWMRLQRFTSSCWGFLLTRLKRLGCGDEGRNLRTGLHREPGDPRYHWFTTCRTARSRRGREA